VTRKRRPYHHGDLRAALIDTAVDLIAEHGVGGFSLAEASRRLGVASSAPYAHFADRDELVAAVAVRACDLFQAELVRGSKELPGPAERLAEMARTYVRFAGRHRPLFEALFASGLDKRRHPELKAAEQPIDDAFQECVRALSGNGAESDELAAAVEAAAHGHAMFLVDGNFGEGDRAVELAAERAARVTLALIESRRLLADEPARG
jgi:AcrR family transcriptional regulator